MVLFSFYKYVERDTSTVQEEGSKLRGMEGEIQKSKSVRRLMDT
jgi:hypothetical protein